MRQVTLIFLLLTILAACGGSDDASPTATPEPLVTPTPDDFPIEERQQLEAIYEQLRQSHVQLSDIWESLARGETAQCGDFSDLDTTFISVIDPELHEVFNSLQMASSELFAAKQRWEGECANPRENVPQTVIEGGLLEVRAAGDALREVEVFLAEN